MHGMIFAELRNYIEQKHGRETWNALVAQSNLKDRVYLALREYPDAEAMALVSAATLLTGQTATALLEEFGEFLVQGLLKMYGHLLRPQWRTLDVIEHTEKTIHHVVRVETSGAHPPHLRAERRNSDEVSLVYTSQRRMCALAVGIGKGLAKHFHEEIVVTQAKCMRSGADHCEILFRSVR